MSAHWADRGLLVLTVGWLGIRLNNWTRLSDRPPELYEPLMWLGKLVFPEFPSTLVWLSMVVVAGICTVICWFRPRQIIVRLILAILLLLIITPEFGFGHIQHINHLFLLAHVYGVIRPSGVPANREDAELRARGWSWYLLGLLAVYTASGVWKVVDMTVRDVLKPGVTWLDSEAMLVSTIASMRAHDFPMTIANYVHMMDWIFPIGYLLLTVIFTASFVAAFERRLLLLVLPVIVLFHILNAVTLYALFLTTIVVVLVLMTPYDFFVPSIRNELEPLESCSFSGSGGSAIYIREYVNGDSDRFLGFYAFRERLWDQNRLLAAPCFFPLLGWAADGVARKFFP